MIRAVVAVALALCACATPQPPPLPTPAPGALWPARVFDCHLPVVADERPVAIPDVRACLLRVDLAPCLVGLAWTSNTIGCCVRRIDMDGTAHINAGSADQDERRAVEAARKLANDGVWGYR